MFPFDDVIMTKEINPRLAKRPLKTNGRLVNLELTSLVKEATGAYFIKEVNPSLNNPPFNFNCDIAKLGLTFSGTFGPRAKKTAPQISSNACRGQGAS